MNKRFTNWIAFKYFFSKKQTGLISFTSWISIIGVAIGIFALIVSVSVLNGFDAEISRRLIDFESHIKITGKELVPQTLEKLTDVLKKEKNLTIYPAVTSKSILTNTTKDAAVKIKAVDSLARIEMFADRSIFIRGGNYLHSPLSELPGIILGYRLVDRMGLYIGDTVNVVNPVQIGSTFNIPYVGQFVLTGVFRLDLFDYDDNVAYIDLREGQRIFKKGEKYSEINIKFDSYERAEKFLPVLKNFQGNDFHVNTWEELHKTLFGAMKLEKYGTFLALSLIIFVAVFNLTSSLVMLVMEKIKEIGMLQALGVNREQLRKIFTRLGMLTGSIGLLVGLVLSVGLMMTQQKFHFIPLPSVYFIPYLPVKLMLNDVILITVTGLIFIFLGTLYPAYRVSKLMPLEAIRYEK